MTELNIPDSAVDAILDVAGDVHETDDEARADVRRIATPVVAQFLRDLAAKHDRVTGGLLAELADKLDGQS